MSSAADDLDRDARTLVRMISRRRALQGTLGMATLLAGAGATRRARAFTTLKIATLFPKASPWGQVCTVRQKAVSERSGGELRLELTFLTDTAKVAAAAFTSRSGHVPRRSDHEARNARGLIPHGLVGPCAGRASCRKRKSPSLLAVTISGSRSPSRSPTAIAVPIPESSSTWKGTKSTAGLRIGLNQ